LKETAIIAKATRNIALFIWMWLLYEAWYTGSVTISVSNEALEPYEIGREAKRRALDLLARTGAISVHRRGSHAPKVTVNEKFLSGERDSTVR
jgi:hypothetical protein